MAGPEERTYGVLGEFETADELVAAARRAWAAGYRHLNAYSPFPVEGLPHMLGYRAAILPLLGLAGVLVGAGLMYGLQYWMNVVDYPINVGGRPYHSWPAFIPLTFELIILVAGFAAVLGMLGLNGLPQPYHPVFNVPGFELASSSRFFLVIEAADLNFDRERTREFLESLEPEEVSDIAP